MLETPNIKIIPFDACHAEKLQSWFYDDYYKNFFRHIPRALKLEDFAVYNKITNSDLYVVMDKATASIAGMIQVNYDGKTNKAAYHGLVIDRAFKGNNLSFEAYATFLNYFFNKQGFRKVIAEVLATHKHLVSLVNGCGFVQEGVLKEECFIDGEYVDEVRYCMFNTTFNELHRKRIESWS